MNRWLLIFLLSLTALRLFLGSQAELSPDETYYFQWSQRLDWAYYSKGPGVATAIWLGTALFGPTELGVRFLSPFFALGTSLLIFALARRLYGNSVATWSVLLLNLTPIFQACGMVMTIDALSIFFWAAALLAFWLALERSPRFSWFWPLTGLCLGLGFLSKYTNAMELLSIILVLALTPKLRQEFRRPGFWTMLAVFLLSVIPPVVWNAHHDWITIDHLRSRGGIDGQTGGFHPTAVLNFIGLHFGVYSPLMFAGMLVALYWGCREARVHFKVRFLVLFALPLILMYLLLAFKRTGEPNWTAPAFVSLGILTAAFWHDLSLKHLAARRFSIAALALGLVMSLVLINTDAVRQFGLKWPYDKDPSARLRGWQTAAIAVDDLRHRLEKEGGKPLFLIGNKYQTASSLSFYLPEKRSDGPGHPPVYIPESQAIENQYSFWPRYDEMIEPTELARQFLTHLSDPVKREALAAALSAVTDPKLSKEGQEAEARRRALIRALLAVDPNLPLDEYASEEAGVSLFHGRDALYITDRAERRPPGAIKSGFEKVELIATLQETRRGLPLREIRVFACRNYRSLSL